MSDGQRLGLIIDGVDIFKKWGIKVKSRNIGKPSKKKVLESVAHSSEVFDFSSLYGGDTYTERQLNYVLNIKGSKPDRMAAEFMETEFNNFIMTKSKFKLVDEIFPGYYFLAEVREGTDFSPLFNFGELNVTFDAYAFRIKQAREGSPYWDDYSILDYYQETKFTINGSRQVELLNNGSNDVVPIITTTTPMRITLNGSVYDVSSGVTRDESFMLPKGTNKIQISGNGTIDFEFHKELI